MSYASLARTVVDYARAGEASRVIAIDLETKVMTKDQFLTNERILGISIAWKLGENVRTEVLVLNEENDDSEWKLLGELDQLLLQLRPLVVVGYYLTHYDMPLLSIKMRKTSRPYWGIEDTMSRAFVLDLKDPVRFEVATFDGCAPKALSLDVVVKHPRFARIPLMRARGLCVGTAGAGKGAIIYDLWRKKREEFVQYSCGDAHDTLLIFEELFPSPKSSRLPPLL